MFKTQQDDSDVASAALRARFDEILTGSWKSQALYVAAELRIADLLADRPRSSADLASATSADPPSMRRLLTALASFHICREREDDRFELLPLGRLLQDEAPDSLRAWTVWWGKYLWPVWGNLLYSVKTGRSARTLLLGTDGFAHLDKDPDAAATFYRVTIELTRETAQQIVQAYDFSGLRTIVDVGGGYGEMLAYILAANPESTGLLFDLPFATNGAAENFKANHAVLETRCRFVAGDFFETVPFGADAYILKSVIHDWNRERSIQILQNCRRAIAPGSRLLVVEPILPERGASVSQQATLSRHDLTMLVALGAQERTQAEFADLLAAADLEIARIVPAGPIYNVIECIPARSS